MVVPVDVVKVVEVVEIVVPVDATHATARGAMSHNTTTTTTSHVEIQKVLTMEGFIMNGLLCRFGESHNDPRTIVFWV